MLFAVAFGLAVVLSGVLTPLVGLWASNRGFVAKPRQDRWHQKPTPLMGGIAIYAATTLTLLTLAPIDSRLLGVIVGGAILFVTGLVDDILHLRPHTKLVVQIVAACVLLLSGVQMESSNFGLLMAPLTVIWVVGLTNAFNLLDNMDGLSAGTAAIAAAFLFAFSVSTGNLAVAVLCLAVAGAAMGFLIYNFNPAKIFMGDSGSMFLGFTLSAVALLGTREMASDIFFVLLVPAAMMALPIFDTTLVTIVRTIEGRPLSQGGRDHLSHRLVALGMSERQAVLLLYLFGAGFGSLGLIARSVGLWASLTVAGVLVVFAVLLGAYLAQVRIMGPSQFAQAERADNLRDRPVVNGMIMFKREMALAALDFALIGVAYLGAYLLRFGYRGDAFLGPNTIINWPVLFSESLPIVIAVKLALLLAFQVYRGMWRYVGLSDLITLAKVSVVSSVILTVALPLVFRDWLFPRSLMVIDWLLFTMLIAGSRVSFAALSDTFSRLRRQRLPRVLVVGAGDLGELVLRSILRSNPKAYDAVGVLDPDPSKRNRSIHGVLVVGTPDDLERITLERDVDFVVLALPQADTAVVSSVRTQCDALNLACYPAATFVELHFAGGLGPRPTAQPASTAASH